jgi:hypothetical protein
MVAEHAKTKVPAGMGPASTQVMRIKSFLIAAGIVTD